jgi:hypothetical protein
MTTRSGLTGILTGMIISFLLYLFATGPLTGWQMSFTLSGATGAALTVILMILAGFLSAKRCGSVQPARCAALGALAGGLSGTIVFCLWGAAGSGSAAGEIARVEGIRNAVCLTMEAFLALFLGGGVLGALSGWLACPRGRAQPDLFDKTDPQMALNVSITAVPASIVAAALAAVIFPRLAGLPGGQALSSSVLEMPLDVSLLLVVISQFALTLVVPHEARQAEHRCGTDEVKMAAYVGIGAAPFLILLLSLVNLRCFSSPLVIVALLAVSGMSIKSLHSLVKVILPRRAAFPLQKEEWQRTEARWFGTIANSYGPRLVMLCTGCGMAMVLPLYICVVSVLINLSAAMAESASAPRLFLTQALASGGIVAASVIALSAIYLFYLNLGRWFSQWISRRTKQ